MTRLTASRIFLYDEFSPQRPRSDGTIDRRNVVRCELGPVQHSLVLVVGATCAIGPLTPTVETSAFAR